MRCKRTLSFLLCFMLVIVVCIGRVGYVGLSNDFYVSSSYNSYTLLIDKRYPTVYDVRSALLTNASDRYVAVIKPDEKCLSELTKLFDTQEISDITQELKIGYPIVREIDAEKKDVTLEYIKVLKCKVHYDTRQLCAHLISGVTGGVESHFSELFSQVSEMSVNYAVDAKGRLLAGDTGTVHNESYASHRGIGLTVDREIQQIAENAMDTSRIEKGAVVITDVDSGAVRALCSRPNIDLTNVADAQNDFLNRALQAYSVGSVFKIVVACCALENGMDNVRYTCHGKIRVADTDYACQNTKAHGAETLKTALANSCNCFFVKLALQLGADKVLKTARAFGFGGETRLMENDSVSDGNLPDENDLLSKGQLALLGFGQGLLTSTPLHFCTALCALSNGGVYREPRLVAGTVDINEDVKETGQMESKRVISEETSKILRSYMRYVVTNGTGSAAEYNDSSAGKTSTAQSGIYKDGREVLNTWFAGIYPYDDPKYAIVVMTEDGTSGSSDCCPIFRTIVESIS